MFLLGFPTGWNRATFWDKGTEVPSLSRSVPGQRDNGTSSKSCHRTGQAGTVYQNLGQNTGRDNHYFSVKIRDKVKDGMGQSLFFAMIPYFKTSFPVLELPFPVLEHPFLF